MIVVMLASAAVIVAAFALTYVIGQAIGRHNVVDAAWGATFAAVALAAAVLGDGNGARRWLLAVLVGVWGLRLSAYLVARSRGRGEDPRYDALLAKAAGTPASAALIRIYLVQAVLIWVISLPVQLSAVADAPLPWWSSLGVAVWAVGFGFEAIGDAQMRRFKSDPANHGKVMDRGPWRLTRHPNYFGDASVWWGIYLIAACGGAAAAATAFSPLIMTLLLVRVSGKALLERNMADRPGYGDYVRRTSGFIPLPPRS